MKLTLRLKDGRAIKLKMPEGDRVEVPDEKCPHCSEPLVVQGAGKYPKTKDTWGAQAICLSCNRLAGELLLEMSTLFGIEEDQRVFSMGIKIY